MVLQTKMITIQYYFWPSGSLMVYWALTSARRPERISAGVSLFERFLHVISEFSDPLTQTHFYLDSLPLLHRLATMDEPLAIRLPAAVDVDCGGESTVDAEALLEWVTERAEDLTRQFDARNGNDYFQQRLAGRMKL